MIIPSPLMPPVMRTNMNGPLMPPVMRTNMRGAVGDYFGTTIGMTFLGAGIGLLVGKIAGKGVDMRYIGAGTAVAVGLVLWRTRAAYGAARAAGGAA